MLPTTSLRQKQQDDPKETGSSDKVFSVDVDDKDEPFQSAISLSPFFPGESFDLFQRDPWHESPFIHLDAVTNDNDSKEVTKRGPGD